LRTIACSHDAAKIAEYEERTVFGGYRANSEGGKFEAEPPRHFRNALAWLGMSVEDLPGASLRDWPA